MDKLLNKIKLAIAPYLREDVFSTDFQKGKMSLAKQIADIIDVVNDDNLQISKIDIGDVVINKTLPGLASRSLGGKDRGYLQLVDDEVEVYCKRVPFIADNDSNSYKIIVQKVAKTKDQKEKELKDAENPPKNYVIKVQAQGRIRKRDLDYFYPVGQQNEPLAHEVPDDLRLADMMFNN